ncbi:ligase-associated DNA damage response exonuclease [bacterium]|nr:ligase-associated DNA damage response exonuclease [bacterium]
MKHLVVTPKGLYCPLGDFYVDPCVGVDRAIITHGHSDHARPGSKHYLCSESSMPILATRLGSNHTFQGIKFTEKIKIGEATVSLHPAGHILGSAQVRIEHQDYVTVVSGDYKVTPDPAAEPFELVKCNCFISETTFGVPAFVWPKEAEVIEEIKSWWQENADKQTTSVIFAYALGKSQRILSSLCAATIGPIFVHESIKEFVPIYKKAGIQMPVVEIPNKEKVRAANGSALIICPQSSQKAGWLDQFKPYQTALASGWMKVKGAAAKRKVDRGFVLSDHADWPGLLDTIKGTGAEEILVTHGYTDVMSQYLSKRGYNARVL